MTILTKVCALVASAGLLSVPSGMSNFVAPRFIPNNSNNLHSEIFANNVEQESQLSSEELPESVSSVISDNATLVSSELAVEPTGEIKNVVTGEPVNDPNLVGTQETPADPLAKTQGKSFDPVQVSEVKSQIESEKNVKAEVQGARAMFKGKSLDDPSATQSSTYSVALGNNGYGAHWGTHNGSQAFFQSNNALFAQRAKGVIDVSQWQGNINWEVARNSGVEGAIIRIGYGWGNGFDTQALRNINECRRLGIPFGIYLYSYAYDSDTATHEGNNVVDLLNKAGVKPSDLSYPVYYDLEPWAWTGHAHPTDPAVYDGMVNAWYARLQAGGFNNLSIYSYPYYLKTALNAPSIHAKVNWVASYGPTPLFDFPNNTRCWQYADNGKVNGINGFVDLNACGVLTASNSKDMPIYRVYNPNSGEHFLTSNEFEYHMLSARGWNGEGIAWVAPADGAPTFRLYSLNQGRHFYTVNGKEYDMLTHHLWRQEGVIWRSGGTMPVYRVYNPNGGEHLFTVGAYERSYLVSLGWHDEGIGWYALRHR